MGRPKATLPFGPEVMLARVVRVLGLVVDPVVVVAAADQELPTLPPTVLVVRDEEPDRGPLQGLAGGLIALQDRAQAAYVTSCDVPLLSPSFVERLVTLLGDQQIAVPVDEAFQHPLSAIYRLDVLPLVRRLLSEDRRRPAFLFDLVPTRRVPTEDLRGADPGLGSLRNVNEPAEYWAALIEAGFKPPDSNT